MKIAYFDCFSGASGDMILGALVDAGLPLAELSDRLAGLKISGWELTGTRVRRSGLSGTKVDVVVDPAPAAHRHLADIAAILDGSDLSQKARQQSLAVFTRLAEAEARVHGTDVESIHFHEVGAVDAIVDIAGAVVGLEALGVETLFASALHTGCGTVKCAHGVLPVPAPATAELVRGVPVYATGVEGELLTPTAAAILTTLAEGFGEIPEMTVEKIGYGAGAAERELPNLLRVCIGEKQRPEAMDGMQRVAVIETGIDDMNPQVFGHVSEILLEKGVLDVTVQHVQMKKNRPGTLLTILCPAERVEEIAALVFRETTTIGLRWRMENRITADREFRTVDTPYGPVGLKVARYGGRIVNVSPEYEDCRRLARQAGAPLKAVMESARLAAAKQTPDATPDSAQPS